MPELFTEAPALVDTKEAVDKHMAMLFSGQGTQWTDCVCGLYVVNPVFRSGTTFLLRLMGRDSRFWALRLYELIELVLLSDRCDTVTATPDDSIAIVCKIYERFA